MPAPLARGWRGLHLAWVTCLQVTHSDSPSANTSATASETAAIAVPWLERLWHGYDVYSTRNLDPAETVTEQYRARFLGSKGSNKLLTGLFLQQVRHLYSWHSTLTKHLTGGIYSEHWLEQMARHVLSHLQERFVLTCHGHYGRLGYACQDQQFAYLSQCEAVAGPHCLLLICACLLAVNN